MVEVTPWWQALKIRPEIIDASGQIDDVQMSLYQAVHGSGDLRPPYADASYYGEITYPTRLLIEFLTEIAIRLGAGPADYHKARALTRLDQGMGGGKSHACIGAYHLAANPAALASTDLGKAVLAEARTRIGKPLPADLNNPHVVVLACDNMTPGAPDEQVDGPAKSMYERFLWRLLGPDYTLYERYKAFFNNKAKIAEALRAINRPVLVVIDEIMNYLGNASDKDAVLAGQDIEFLRALLDTINDVPNVAGIVVMIASDKDPMAQSTTADERRTDLNTLLERNGLPATVTANADFADILRRRLFDRPPPGEVLAATAELYQPVLADRAWVRNVWSNIVAPWLDNFADAVARTYPFHPQLMHLAEHEWATVSGFQRVRSTIKIFAATVYALQQRGKTGQWAPLLIGPGDLLLSDNNIREAILGSGLVGDDRTIGNYRSLAENEVVSHADDSGAARRLDLSRTPAGWTDTNPRAAERGATFVFLASIVGARPGGRRGASAPEVKAATSVPDLTYVLADADGVVEDLVNPDHGMSAVEILPGQGNNRPARYFLSTRLTYRMLVNNLRKTVTDVERDNVIAEFAERLTNTGPFKKKIFVAADPVELRRSPLDVLATAGIDDARTTRLVVLDATQFSLRNGGERETVAAMTAAMGLGVDRIPVEWASSAIFVVANTQRRAIARGSAAEYLARQRALATPEVQRDDELKATGTRELADAKANLEKAVKRAYQHVAYLAQPDVNSERHLDEVTFDDENKNLTALDGTQVWKALVEREKAFDVGQFTGTALLHNLRDQDYLRPLSEVRDSFWNAPRLPLLHGGERDLQQAIYDAVRDNVLRVVDGQEKDVIVTDASQVNTGSSAFRLAKPAAEEGSLTEGDAGAGASGGQAGAGADTTSSGESTDDSTERAEKYVQFTLVGNLLDSPDKMDSLARVFRTLYSALDDNVVSYAQGTLQLVMSSEIAETFANQIRDLGLNPTIRDQ